MDPWKSEANLIDLGDIDTSRIENLIVPNFIIKDFLKYGENDKKLFIVAPKGLGKTLLLKAKSQLYRDKASGYSFIPKNDLVEKFNNNKTSFSHEDLKRFTSLNVWVKTWEICLYTLILKRFSVDLPSEIDNIIGEAKNLSDILAVILNNRSEIDSIYGLVPKVLRPRVRLLQEEDSINQIAIFIDNIDESFEEHTGYLLSNSKQSEPLSEEIWINAQLSILTVARDICSSNKHVKIFISIRSEAFNNSQAQTDLQLREYTTFLKYSKQEVKEIFIKNILNTPDKRLVFPDKKDPFERFIGFTHLPHRFALDRNDNSRIEHIFDYIYRHTFGRPRELIRIGGEIFSEKASLRSPIKIYEIVKEASAILFNQFKKEIVPFFKDEIFEEFCMQAKSNVITFNEAERISTSVTESYGFKNVLSYLYRLGLIGITKHDNVKNATLVQQFLPVGQYSLQPKRIPEFPDHFVIHSCLDESLKEYHGNHFYNTENIIGDNYDFIVPKTRKSKVKHTHFGLNRDSKTLMIPELHKTKKLAVIQQPHPDFTNISSAQKVVIQTSNNEVIKFNLIHDKSTKKEIKSILNRWENGESFIAYTKDKQTIKLILSESETISSLFNDSTLEYYLTFIVNLDKKQHLYLSQRYINNKMQRRYLDLLKAKKITNLKIFRTLIDRFHFETIEYFDSSNVLVYDISCEAYGAVICRNRSQASMRSNKLITRTDNNHEQTFYENRQKLLVEGIYKLIKVFRIYGTQIQTNETLERTLELFCEIQISRLLKKSSQPVLDKVFNLKTNTEINQALLDFCTNTISRISNLPKKYDFSDQTGYINKAKRFGFFPNDLNFYTYTKASTLFLENEAVLELKEILRIKDFKKYESVFISYSFNDSDFALELNKCLSKRGVTTFLFEIDDPNRPLDVIMTDEIKRHDKVLFIASSSSVKSEACQYELSTGREKFKKTWKQVFIPIRIDNYILEITKTEIGNIEKRDEYWMNICALKEINISDFSNFKSNIDVNNRREFENMIDRLVDKNLIRR